MIPRGFQAAWNGCSRLLNLNDLGDLNAEVAGDALQETSTDDFHIRVGKRLKRGARFFRDPNSVPRLAVTCVILYPLQMLMAFLFQESKHAGTDMNEYCTRINTLMTELVELGEADVVEDEKWRLPNLCRDVLLSDLQWLGYIRRELHRAYGRCR